MGLIERELPRSNDKGSVRNKRLDEYIFRPEVERTYDKRFSKTGERLERHLWARMWWDYADQLPNGTYQNQSQRDI